MTNTDNKRLIDTIKVSGKQFTDYAENDYGKRPRYTNDEYRSRLCSWQVPAIKKHFGNIEGSNFLDIGAGDIVLGEMQSDIGRPKRFFVQDLSQPSLFAGLKRLSDRGIDISNIKTLVSDNFDFSDIRSQSIDFAFSNSLFSHLTLNSILLCLRNLHPKMKTGSKYLSSMIVVPGEIEPDAHDWSHMKTKGGAPVSSPIKDPYHYTVNSIEHILGFNTGFEVTAIHDYGHTFQNLVEFSVRP